MNNRLCTCQLCRKEYKINKNWQDRIFCSTECKFEAYLKGLDYDKCKCYRTNECIFGNEEGRAEMCNFYLITGRLRGGYPYECKYFKEKNNGNNQNSRALWIGAPEEQTD